MQRNLVTAFLSVVSGHVLGTVVAVLTAPLLVRILGPASYGEYAALYAAFGFIMILPKSGIHDGLRKYLAEERPMGEWQNSVFGFYFRLATFLTFLVAGLFLLLPSIPLFDIPIVQKYEQYLPLLAVWAFVNQYSAYFRNSFMGLKLEHVSEPLKLLRKASFGVSAVFLAYVGHGVTGVIVAHILSALLVIVVSVALIRGRLSLDAIRRRVPSGFPARELAYFNVLTVLYILLLRSLAHVDVLMLEYFTTSTRVGYYKSALVLVEFLWFVPLSIQATMLQSTSDLWRQQKRGQIEQIAARVTRYTLLFTTLLAIGLAALAPVVVPLYYGQEFTPAVVPLLILAPGTVGFAVARPILAISQAKGQMRTMIAATGITAGVNFGLNLVLIPPLGMIGAAIATTVGYGSLPIVHAIGARRLGYRPFSNVRFARYLVTATLGGVVIFGLSSLIRLDLVALAVVPPVGFVVYSLLAFKTGAIEPAEIAEIVDRLPEPIRTRAALIRNYL